LPTSSEQLESTRPALAPERKTGHGRWAVLTTFYALAWSAWGVGQVLRDTTWITGLCFYIPSVVMLMLGGLVWILTWRTAARGMRTLLACSIVAPGLMVLGVENQWRPRAIPKGDTIRVVHWNIGYGVWGEEGVERELARQKAVLYVLSEVPKQTDLARIAARLGPRFRAVRLGLMAVIGEGELREPTRLVNDNGLRINSVHWRYQGRERLVFAIDQTSDLRVARDPLLRRTRSYLARYQPDLVLGDFNAPRRSRALCPLPEGYSHAYDQIGSGWSATWPSVFPLFAIDQCIISTAITPAAYRLVSSPHSDHCMQIFEFY